MRGRFRIAASTRSCVGASSPSLRSLIASYSDRAERYRRMYFNREPRAWPGKEVEHLEILDACVARDASLAGSLVATHLAKTALTLMTLIAPEREPTAVRTALSLVTRGYQPGALGDGRGPWRTAEHVGGEG